MYDEEKLENMNQLINDAEREYQRISKNCSLAEVITKLELMYGVVIYDIKKQNKDYKSVLDNTKHNIVKYLTIIDKGYPCVKWFWKIVRQ